jgi:hypothetical protein
MKTRKLFTGILSLAFLLAMFSCNDTDQPTPSDNSILPDKFKVDIPGALSDEQITGALKSSHEDALTGAEVYQYLNLFIAVGEEAAEIVQEIMFAIKLHKIESVIDLTYTSDDDGRLKYLVVDSLATYEGKEYQYMLTVTDVDSETNEDGGLAMQVFWSNDPVEGVAILKPYNIDRTNNSEAPEAMFHIEYSAKGTEEYEEYMVVEIAHIPLPFADVDPWALESMKMFVGKNGNEIDVFGNSTHPNAQFNPHDIDELGYSYSFVASGKVKEDIGVAEVGLPSNDSEASTREVILKENAIKTVLSRELTNYIAIEEGYVGYEDLIAPLLEPYLENTEAPGFFNAAGFVQAKTAPSDAYNDLTLRIEALTPFVPAQVSNLTIVFKR